MSFQQQWEFTHCIVTASDKQSQLSSWAHEIMWIFRCFLQKNLNFDMDDEEFIYSSDFVGKPTAGKQRECWSRSQRWIHTVCWISTSVLHIPLL